MLGGWRSVPWLFLLRERQSEPTLDSFSDLLFSRSKVPNPKRLLNDVLELSEPAAAYRLLESMEPQFGVLKPGVSAGNSASISWTRRSMRDMKSFALPAGTSISANAAVIPRSPSLLVPSSSSAKRLMTARNAR